MESLEHFVNDRLKNELEEFNEKNIGTSFINLSIHEKVLIYYYTLEGYQSINEELRESKNSQYETHLNNVLTKLPNFEGLVYRGLRLSNAQLKRYIDCFISNTPIEELGFCSCSESILVARLFGNATFSILSKSGKSVQELSFYGSNSSQNEQEVLFRSKTKFKILDVDNNNGDINIILEEIL